MDLGKPAKFSLLNPLLLHTLALLVCVVHFYSSALFTTVSAVLLFTEES